MSTQCYLRRLSLEREDIHEDLLGVELSKSDMRIGDFGCGKGFTTLSLMLELRPSECIGIDKFEKNDELSVPSLDDVKQYHNKIRKYLFSNSNEAIDNTLSSELHHLYSVFGSPIFHVGDIVSGDKLPTNLDFVYCKKVLTNIYNGSYNNSYQGDEGVKRAVENITNSIHKGGLICIVEPAGINFMYQLNPLGLTMIRCCRINRNQIIEDRRDSILKEQCIVYLYKK